MRIRPWLEANKVFFETIAAVLLSGMAIVIAIMQTSVATKQTELMELQTRVAEVQILPRFEVHSYTSTEDAPATFVVSNRGASIDDLVMDYACFVMVDSKSKSGETTRKEIPAWGCVGSAVASWGGTGEGIARLNSMLTALQTVRVDQALMEGAKQAGYEMRVHTEIILSLRYRDLLKRDHEDFFATAIFGRSGAISDSEGASLIRRWKLSEQARKDISTLTLSDILREPSTSATNQRDAALSRR